MEAVLTRGEMEVELNESLLKLLRVAKGDSDEDYEKMKKRGEQFMEELRVTEGTNPEVEAFAKQLVKALDQERADHKKKELERYVSIREEEILGSCAKYQDVRERTIQALNQIKNVLPDESSSLLLDLEELQNEEFCIATREMYLTGREDGRTGRLF